MYFYEIDPICEVRSVFWPSTDTFWNIESNFGQDSINNPNNKEWMSKHILLDHISKTWPPILLKLDMYRVTQIEIFDFKLLYS